MHYGKRLHYDSNPVLWKLFVIIWDSLSPPLGSGRFTAGLRKCWGVDRHDYRHYFCQWQSVINCAILFCWEGCSTSCMYALLSLVFFTISPLLTLTITDAKMLSKPGCPLLQECFTLLALDLLTTCESIYCTIFSYWSISCDLFSCLIAPWYGTRPQDLYGHLHGCCGVHMLSVFVCGEFYFFVNLLLYLLQCFWEGHVCQCSR